MKTLLLTFLLFSISSRLWAQDDIKKDDITIHINGSDAWGGHRFLVDIDIKQNTAKIYYAFQDSIRMAKVSKDANYKRAYANTNKYKNGDPKNKAAWDSIGTLFEKYSIYTRAFKKINLKTDTAYRNLIERVVKANKDELSPDINANSKVTKTYIVIADGNSLNLTIITPSAKRTISTHAPDMEHQPLLIGFMKSTLDKKRNSSAAKKISQWHVQ
ncbi:MAG: hypothetical protein V4553_15615 [Bacteroidota bacterium]